MVQSWAPENRKRAGTGGAAGLMLSEISLRSSAQMGRWQVSSSRDLICGLLKDCF